MFSSFFNLDNPVFKFLSMSVDLVVLNIVFVITCIPVFTIGAALTSLQYVMVTGWDTQNSHLFKSYFKSFKQNFKQSTVVWLIMLAIGAFLGFTGWMVYQQSKVDDSTLFMAFVVVFILICFVYLCIFTYIWPVIAKFENTTSMMFKNSLILAISHLPSTLVVWIIFAIGAYFMYSNIVVAAFGVLILCAVIAYLQGKVFRNVFVPYLGEVRHDENEMVPDSWEVDLENSYAGGKREVAELAAKNAAKEEAVLKEEALEEEIVEDGETEE